MNPVTLNKSIEQFFAGASYAVVGASRDRSKYGNKVLRAYLHAGRKVFPVNPSADEVEGVRSYPDLSSLPERVHSVSIVTPPEVTEAVVDEAVRLGIRNVWMQPGAESDEAIRRAEEAGMNVIAGGPCALVALRFRERERRR